MNNQKMRLLSLVLAAAIALGSVTAFADGEPAAPETNRNDRDSIEGNRRKLERRYLHRCAGNHLSVEQGF